MPGIKGFARSKFPQIRVGKDVYEILRKLRVILQLESMEQVIKWLLLNSKGVEGTLLREHQNSEYWLMLREISSGELRGVFRERIDDSTERVKDACNILAFELRHGNRLKVEAELKSIVGSWNQEKPWDPIKIC